MPEIYIIGGCNGSGKTTLALNVFPNLADDSKNKIEFVNADIIAAELSPNNPYQVAIQASRIMLQRLKTLALERVDFAFETTLAARSFAPFLRQCQAQGYQVNLIYVWLNSIELAINRVALRVASGGHNIPEDVIRRRYTRGRTNFLELYSELANRWQVYDNSGENKLIAFSSDRNQAITIIQTDIWQRIINYE
ncbi:MAG: zeta toxin family protein [Cyanobacteria bacterium J06621_8]